MATFKPQESKREEFRKYLERAGVMDAVTKVFAALYEEQEKPADALEYVYKALGEDRPCREDDELQQYTSKIQALESALAEAKAKIRQLEEANAKKVGEMPPRSPAAAGGDSAVEPSTLTTEPSADVTMTEDIPVAAESSASDHH